MKIDRTSHVLICQQIAGGVRAAIDAGLFRPSERLPSLPVRPADPIEVAADSEPWTIEEIMAREG